MAQQVEDTTVDQIKNTAAKATENVSRVVVGKEEVVELAIVALPCEGHIQLGRSTVQRENTYVYSLLHFFFGLIALVIRNL